MDDPLQNNGTILKKIENDIEVLIMLQKATNLYEENVQAVPKYDERDTEFASIPESDKNTIVEPDCYAPDCSESRHIFPHDHIQIKLTCSPTLFNNESDKIEDSNCCQRHLKSASQSKLTKTQSYGKCVNKRNLVMKTNGKYVTSKDSRVLQAKKYTKMKSEKSEDHLRSKTGYLKANDNVEDSDDRYERLRRDMEKLKKSVSELIKLKKENSDLQCQLALNQKETASLLAQLQSKEETIRNFEKSLKIMKCENKFMLEERENNIQSLMAENLELAKKLKEYDKTLANLHNESEEKERSYLNELSKRPSVKEIEEQKYIWEEKFKKYECIIREKDDFIKEVQDKYQELKIKYRKAKEDSHRSLLTEKELTNSNMALEDKLTETEKEKEELKVKLDNLENENEEKESELKHKMEQMKKRIEELTEANKTLEESLHAQSKNMQKKDNEIKVIREQSRDLTDQLEALQNSASKNGDKLFKEVSQQTIEESAEEDNNLNKLDAITKELENTRKDLEREKDEVLNRERIIHEYEERIQKIQHEANQRSEELEKVIIEKERAEMNMKTSFCQERRQNEILLDELTKLRWHEKELTQQLNETLAQLSEYEVENAETEEVFVEHSLQLQQIEDAVEKKTAEWYSYVAKLTQERDVAINTARAARQKLMASLAEFQKHFAVQRRVQEVLTGLLRQRECDLKFALKKIIKSRCVHTLKNLKEDSETSEI